MSIYLGARKILTESKSTVNVKDFLKKDGSISMAGNLDLGNYAIDNLKTYPVRNNNATSRKYVDDECNKLLDLEANRPLTGDLNLNGNAIIGISDISADNSVPSKKYVKDSLKSRDSKITQNENQAHLNASRNLGMQNEINSLKSLPIYSHYFSFFYQNPVANVYKGPHTSPAGFPFDFLWLTKDYNENTTLTLLGINTDDDTTLPSTNVNFSVEGIFHSKSGGYNSKVFLSSKNIHPFRVVGENEYYIGDNDAFTFTIKDFHNNWRNWHKFYLKVAVPWSGNETRLSFCVNYFLD